MGRALVMTGRAEAAIPHFTKVYGRATALYTIGQLLYDQQDAAAAESYVARALERDPALEPAKSLMARLNARSNVQQAAGTRSRGTVRQADAIELDGRIE